MDERLLLDIVALENSLASPSGKRYATSEGVETLRRYAASESSKARRLALRISLENGLESAGAFSIDDPSASVRALAISACIDVTVLGGHVRDRNPDVRVAVLRRLSALEIPPLSQNSLLPLLLHLINDQSDMVRLLFTKLMRKFSAVESALIFGMLDKEKDGTFIYGAEDELVDVRMELVRSLECFIRRDTATALFNFLFDMLNDGYQEVRVGCMKLLSKITRKFHIEETSQDLAWLVLSSGTQSQEITRYLVRVLSHIRYRDREALATAFSQAIFGRFENEVVLGILRRVIKRNKRVLGGGMLFSTPEQRETYQIQYLCDLLLIDELGERVEIRRQQKKPEKKPDKSAAKRAGKKPEKKPDKSAENSADKKPEKNVEKDVQKDVQMLRTTFSSLGGSKQKEIGAMLEALEAKRKAMRGETIGGEKMTMNEDMLDSTDHPTDDPTDDLASFTLPGLTLGLTDHSPPTKRLKTALPKPTRMISSAGKFLKEYFHLLDTDIPKAFLTVQLIPYKFRFRRRLFRKLFRHTERTEQSLLELTEGVLRAFSRHPLYADTRECTFVLRQAKGQALQGLPTELWVEAQVERPSKRMRFVVEAGNDRLLFNLERRMKITVDIWQFKCYIGMLIGDEVLKLTSEMIVQD